MRTAWMALFLVMAGVVTAGCTASRYDALKNERDDALFEKSDEHACLCREFGESLVETHRVATRGDTGQVIRVVVHDCGPRDGAPVVLVHGVFADHHSWRFVAPLLARTRRVLIVDLPGCGESDAPVTARETEGAVYSPRAMAWRLGEAVEHVLGPDEGRVTVVAHSLGGLVTLRMLSDPGLRERFAALGRRIDRLVLIAPLDGIIEKADPAFLAVAKLSDMDVALGSMFGVIRERVTDIVLKSVSEESDALRAEADMRLEILMDRGRRRAMQAMLRQAVPLKPGAGDFDPDWDRMLAEAVRVREIEQPTVILWGERDEVMSVSMGYRLWANMPRAELRVFPRCRHSPQIEEPAACASVIDDFMEEDLGTRTPGGAGAGSRAVRPAPVIDVESSRRLTPRGPKKAGVSG